MNSATSPAASQGARRPALLAHPNFRWLMAGSLVSLLGDQFTLVALPWLVLRLTGDTVALGTVLALIGVPRAVFILIGGALVDRWSPREVLMVSKHANTVLLAALATGVYFDALSLHGIYVLALLLGLASAFGIPSATSMLPHALPPALLGQANGAMMGLRQLSMFLGPLAAGLLIALSGDATPAPASSVQEARGIAIAFALDALSFALSAWTLSRVRLSRAEPAAGGHAGLAEAVLQGLRHVAADSLLRTSFLYWGCVALLVMGPLHIAVPVLASSQPHLGASALGLMMGAHGAGTLMGMVAAGLRPGWRIGTLGTSLLLADMAIGLLCMPLGSITARWQGAVLMLAIGLIGGYLQVAVFTWMQRRVPPGLVGRTTSLFMFIFMGLVPVSAAAAGWLLRVISLQALFMGAGALLIGVAVLAWVATPIRGLREG